MKKAARKAERLRLKQQNETSLNHKCSDEECNDIGNGERNDEDANNDEESKCEVQNCNDSIASKSIGCDHDVESSSSSESSKIDDTNGTDTMQSDLPISSKIPIDSSSTSTRINHIEDDFRLRFHHFVHQRMCRAHDEYQNLELGNLLKNYIKEETLDGPNKYLCENCSKKNYGKKSYSKAIRCQLIALPPPILILQLKRFETSNFNSNNRKIVSSMHKLNTNISFPEKLYLAPYTSRIYEYFSKFYEPDCDPDEISDSNSNRLEYTLYGVVKHSGSLRFGHYTANVCVRSDDFDNKNLRRFLHLKPFVSNIEHILQVVHEDLSRKNMKETQEGVNDKLNNSIENCRETTVENSREDKSSESTKKFKRKWFTISDSCVSSITLNSVLKDTVSPYLLFYERTN
ncbi:Ubiquitin carboxyl-terminal hydrolase 16 [Sarcoptes scabiei]|nr:Ubiquitin carboxyl-terminal hydrolase 16 [Sarcoptes scabiei]